MTLTKADLVQKVYQSHASLTKLRSIDAVDIFLALAKGSLISGQNLLLSGFGKFTLKHKQLRRGRNPQTGAALILKARRVVTFKPSGKLRARVN